MKIKLREKLILFFMALAAVPMAAVAVISYYNLNESVQQVVTDGANAMLDELSAEIGPLFSARKSETRLLAKNRPIQNLIRQHSEQKTNVDQEYLVAVTTFLKQFLTGPRQAYREISYYDQTGSHILSYKKAAQSQIATDAYLLTVSDPPLAAKQVELLLQEPGLKISNHYSTVAASDLILSYPIIIDSAAGPAGFVIARINLETMLEQTGNPGFALVSNVQTTTGTEEKSIQTALIISRSTGKILFGSLLGITGSTLADLLPDWSTTSEEFLSFVHNDEKYFANFRAFDKLDWVLFVISKPAQLTASTKKASTINLGITVAATVLMLLLIPFVAGGITSSIRRVTAGAEAIAGGDLDHTIEISTNDETRQLANAFNRMAGSLSTTIYELRQLTDELETRVEERTLKLEDTHKELALAQQHMIDELDRELQTAKGLQMGLMPTESPLVEGLEIVGNCRSATHVGGDLYQYFSDANSVTVVMADVTGHAMEAAIPVVMFDGILDSQIEIADKLEDLFQRLNERMFRRLSRRTYVCCAMAQIDIQTRQLRFANAGCPYPYHYHAATQTITELQVDAFPLGARVGSTYSAVETAMELGDRLVFCSDGIIEAMNEAGDLFGFDKTAETVLHGGSQNLSAQQLMDHLLDEVSTFSGERVQDDDQTVVVVAA